MLLSKECLVGSKGSCYVLGRDMKDVIQYLMGKFTFIIVPYINGVMA